MKIRIIRRRGLGNTSTLGIKKFSKHNIEIVRNDRVLPNDSDLVVRWGCTSNIASKKVLNKSDSIQIIANKYLSRRTMKDAGVKIPELYDTDLDNIQFPVVVRPHHHHQGKNLWLCNDEEELDDLLSDLKEEGTKYYISEYIDKDSEFGVFIFNNRVWSVIEKVGKEENSNENVAWNVNQGSHSFQNVKWSNWPIEAVKEALDAYKCFNIDFARVDVMVKDNIPYILELNSAHSLTSPYRKQTFTKCLDYFIDNGPVKNKVENIKSYKSIIHPALRLNKQEINL